MWMDGKGKIGQPLMKRTILSYSHRRLRPFQDNTLAFLTSQSSIWEILTEHPVHILNVYIIQCQNVMNIPSRQNGDKLTPYLHKENVKCSVCDCEARGLKLKPPVWYILTMSNILYVMHHSKRYLMPWFKLRYWAK